MTKVQNIQKKGIAQTDDTEKVSRYQVIQNFIKCFEKMKRFKTVLPGAGNAII